VDIVPICFLMCHEIVYGLLDCGFFILRFPLTLPLFVYHFFRLSLYIFIIPILLPSFSHLTLVSFCVILCHKCQYLFSLFIFSPNTFTPIPLFKIFYLRYCCCSWYGWSNSQFHFSKIQKNIVQGRLRWFQKSSFGKSKTTTTTIIIIIIII